MGVILNEFRAAGITFTPLQDGALKAFGPLTDVARAKIRQHKASILAELSAANDPAPAGAHRRWSIQFPGLPLVDVIFHPEATRDEALGAFPGSVVATPLPEALGRPATSGQADELHGLIALILRDADDADRAEALAVAVTDPDSALTSFRALAADLQPQPPTDADDRRTCRQCTNLSPDGRCRAAERGELPYAASRKYSPVPDLRKRCEGFQPCGEDPDQRPGTERWPSLIMPTLATKRE